MLRYVTENHKATEFGRVLYGLVLWSQHLHRSIGLYGEKDETIPGARKEVKYAVNRLINIRAGLV
jgi:hypothetical protein